MKESRLLGHIIEDYIPLQHKNEVSNNLIYCFRDQTGENTGASYDLQGARFLKGIN